MSSIASLYIVKTTDLPAITAAGPDDMWAAVEDAGARVEEEYDWSGYVMLNVLVSLDEDFDVTLDSPALRAESDAINAGIGYTTLITADAKQYLERLDPSAYEPGDLVNGPSELGLDGPEATAALRDSLDLLRGAIGGLTDDRVLLLHLG